ncbi:hypothetical protein ACP179_00455 (plasmid) [Xenorhabdus stockiae]|uniref:hypothetical protein n=1 Tax=Xenorhabdus stockiae TaxID=351614 RepID=UPI003CEC2F5A
MEIIHYTTQTLLMMANTLNLDPHDSNFPCTLSRHMYTLQCVTHSDGSPCDYQTILNHLLKSLK